MIKTTDLIKDSNRVGWGETAIYYLALIISFFFNQSRFVFYSIWLASNIVMFTKCGQKCFQKKTEERLFLNRVLCFLKNVLVAMRIMAVFQLFFIFAIVLYRSIIAKMMIEETSLTLLNTSEIILMIVVGPISEEIVFRLLLMKYLGKYGSVFSIIASTIMFVLIHNQGLLLIIVVLSIECGVLMLETDCVFFPIIAHIIHNATPTLLIENIVYGDIYYLSGIIIIILVILVLLYGALIFVGNRLDFLGTYTDINLKCIRKACFLKCNFIIKECAETISTCFLFFSQDGMIVFVIVFGLRFLINRFLFLS